jgi:hypothetical protein
MAEWIDVLKKLPSHDQNVIIKSGLPCDCAAVFLQTDAGYIFVSPPTIEREQKHVFLGVTHWKPI